MKELLKYVLTHEMKLAVELQIVTDISSSYMRLNVSRQHNNQNDGILYLHKWISQTSQIYKKLHIEKYNSLKQTFIVQEEFIFESAKTCVLRHPDQSNEFLL